MRRLRDIPRGTLVLGLVGLVSAALFVQLSGIGPDLPGPQFREMLGLVDEEEPGPLRPCMFTAEQDRTPEDPPPPEGRWRREPSLTQGRDELRAATLGGDVYVGTGNLANEDRVLDGSSDRFEAFDPSRGDYRRLAPTPLALNHSVLAASGGRVYLAAGNIGDPYAQNNSDGLWSYTPRTGRWTELANMPEPRYAPVGATIADRLYVTGGAETDADPPYRDLFIYDIPADRWETGPDMPTGRHHAAATALGGRLYVAGGRAPADLSQTAFERFDPATGEWEALAPLPQQSGGLALATAAGNVVAIAGGDDREMWVTRAVWAFDPGENDWRRLPDLRVGRHGHTAAVAGGRIYVLGGAPCAGFGRTASVESLPVSAVRRGE